MTREDVSALLRRCQMALERHDAVGLASEHADDCVMETPTARGAVEGRDGVRDVYAAWFKAFPDLSVNADPPIIDGCRTAQAFTLTGTDTGGFLGLPATGKPFRLPLVVLREVENGIITHSRTIYDFSGMLAQLGVLKLRA